jgi:hypothetical protein
MPYNRSYGRDEMNSIGPGNSRGDTVVIEKEQTESPGQSEVTIFVNTRPKQVHRGEISYDEIVALAYNPVPSGPNVQITVTYFRSQGDKTGDLLPGHSVAVHEDMIFDVVATDLS